MSRHTQPTRRRFLGTLAGGAAAAATVTMSAASRDREETIPDRQQPASPNDQIQIALIGAGIQGTGDTATAITVPGVKLVAVCDLYDGRLTDAKKRWGQDLYTTCDYREILNRPDIDAVIVATPDHWHRQIGVEALGKNKSVYLEKPMVQQLGEGEALIAAQKTSKGILQVGSQGMSSLSNEKARQLLAAGAIGKLLLIRGGFTFFLDRPNDVRLKPEWGGGSIWDVGCYPLSYARFLLGAEPEDVFGWQNTAPSGIDDVFVAQARFPGGAYAQFDCSFRLASRSFIEIVGPGGSITIPEPYKPGKNVKVRLSRADGSSEMVRMPGSELYIGEVEDLADAILLGKASRISLADSRANVAAICGLLESARRAQAIPLR